MNKENSTKIKVKMKKNKKKNKIKRKRINQKEKMLNQQPEVSKNQNAKINDFIPQSFIQNYNS
jgi:hypothetical protein